jgi:carbamoyltransferase
MSSEDSLWILGISASPHNGAVCLLKGDEIVAAIQEERLSRIKRAAVYGAYPSLAIEYCLEYAGIRSGDLSLVVSCVTNRSTTPEQDLSLNPALQTRTHKTPTLYIPHHYGHAVSAFATSGFEESAVLVIDGVGSPFEDFTEDEKAACKWPVEDGWETISLYAASGASIKPLEKHMVEHFAWVGKPTGGMLTFGSLGGMYGASAYQIFGDLHEAGKVMGLAPYGQPHIPRVEFFEMDGGRLRFHDEVTKRFAHNDRWPLRQREYSDLSASVQAALEEAVLHLVERLYEICPSENLCYAGGVALNSVANERIIRESPFRNVYIIPAAEDSGTAVGAAYHGLWRLTKTNTKKRLIHDAVGRPYSEEQILNAIENTPAVEISTSEDAISDAVELLCDGKIVGWFDGRSELGPRALGQRSILCDPRRPEAKDVLNRQVKHRESFRPFAPVVLRENVNEWFDLDGTSPDSPFMLRVCKFREDKKARVPGVVHIDDTGRLQTVTMEANGALYKLAKRFYERTNVPIILNTSFNVAGEPIVETPQDALNTLISTGIDYCVFGSKVVTKRRGILFEHNEVAWPERVNLQIMDALKTATTEAQGKRAEAGHERPLQDSVGTFEHDRHGRLTIDKDGTDLKATLVGALPVRSRISSPIRRRGQDVFAVTSGPLAGYKVIFLRDKRDRVNVVALLQENRKSNSQIFFRAPAVNVLDRAFCEALVGEYEASDKIMTVMMANNKLCVSTPGQPHFELIRTSPGEFYLKKLPGYGVEFKMGASGEVTTAVVTMPSEIVVLEKLNNTLQRN